MMKTLNYVICILVLIVVASCNKADTGGATAETKTDNAPAKVAASPAITTTSDYKPLAGTKLALANGEEIEIISVGKFDSDLQTLGGLIALEGRVAEVFADKGRFLLIDTDREAGCKDGCCPLAEVPVRLALENFEGELPLAETEVIVVGDLTVTSMGYDFSVQEIRQEDKILIQQAPETV